MLFLNLDIDPSVNRRSTYDGDIDHVSLSEEKIRVFLLKHCLNHRLILVLKENLVTNPVSQIRVGKLRCKEIMSKSHDCLMAMRRPSYDDSQSLWYYEE